MANAVQAIHSHPQPGKLTIPGGLKTIYAVFMLIGALTIAAGLIQRDGQERIWHSFLTSFMYFADLALGGLFFAAIQHVAKVGWSVTVRRLVEALTAYLPYAAVSAVGLFFGAKSLYEWTHPEAVAHDFILQGKAGYLNLPAFAIRMAIFFAGWLWFKRALVGNSIKQDETGDARLTLKNVGLSIAFLLFFALSYSLFTVDALMSLSPHWYSTIWGVYNFSGLFQSSLAMIILLTVFVMNKGLVRGLVNENHLHDLGKFLKAFTVFYAYIGFSQFLLIWYANLPEETIFYLNRASGPWMAVTWSLLIFKFAVPFLMLLPKAAKRSPSYLCLVSVLILVMQYVDIHWMVYPNLDNSQYLFGWQEVGIFLGFLGVFLASVMGFLAKNNLVPIRDPRLEESIHHHVTY
jgi:hypothetical protein